MNWGNMTGDDNVRCIAPPQSSLYKQWTGHESEVRGAGGESSLSCADAASPTASFLDRWGSDESNDALNNGVQRIQAEEGVWSGGAGQEPGSGVGVGGGSSVQPSVSPSYPFSRMQLQESLGTAGLGSVDEEWGGWSNGGVMIPPFSEDGDVFDMDIDFEYSLADEDMVGLPALGMIWHIHLTPKLGLC